MKQGIHPKYQQTTITCSCGNSWTTGSTKQNLRVDVCSKCHPFFTGEQRVVDTAGQIERFQRRMRARQGGAGATPAPAPAPAGTTTES